MFPLSSSSIKRSGHEKLDEFVEHLKGMQFGTVRIVGHPDPTGPKAMNERLSNQRAEDVKNYFVSKGIDPKRIGMLGFSAEPSKSYHIAPVWSVQSTRNPVTPRWTGTAVS
jgi:outer membrane protein OmpA-like peptidoglycan-associated protein